MADNQKLTLSVDKDSIANGKRYAKETGRSLSAIVEDYLAALPATGGTDDERPLPSNVRRLIGIAAGTDENDYRRHLEAKYA
ncbi:DUF6364 family protein [Bifidobacterium oedipodis]|uniref:Toxin-antitoxin system protein n=1 Tax=Bifidobacterium oedipodis TaxID=2675322 RepID=A0A7Y0HSH4_9BIFI|nr:DUF6364 family protein [Bifidobacterium sp. DSM 109957]NMM94021.1 toxin-antitoxin system protein [Bifidobacterium sp. DSM 109957]